MPVDFGDQDLREMRRQASICGVDPFQYMTGVYDAMVGMGIVHPEFPDYVAGHLLVTEAAARGDLAIGKPN
jgi:hypothetical protein